MRRSQARGGARRRWSIFKPSEIAWRLGKCDQTHCTKGGSATIRVITLAEETKMGLQGLNHYTLRPVDLEATKDFYEKVLGLELGYRPPLTFPGYWLYCGDNPTVHLIGDRQGEEGLPERKIGHTGLVDHIAFSCTGLAAMRAHLDKHNVAYTARVIPRDRQTQIFLHDPNGVAVELNYPPEETPPD
jgi:catechol 2,3-dioxygenase-like lactoylglutathione lyase family enzyme